MFHKSPSAVCEAISILTLPADILAHMEADSATESNNTAHGAKDGKRKLDLTVAVELARLEHFRGEQWAFYAKWRDHGLKRDEVRELVRLVLDGTFGRLPAEVQSLVLTRPAMTAAIARLLLVPHEDADSQSGGTMRSGPALSSAQIVAHAKQIVEQKLSKQDATALIRGESIDAMGQEDDDELLANLRATCDQLDRLCNGGLRARQNEPKTESIIRSLKKMSDILQTLLDELPAP
jgi:hypothetical protein